MKCSTNKKQYYSEQDALDALIRTRVVFPSNTAKTIYLCDDCNSWHLTSTGEFHPTLLMMMKNGDLEKEIRRYEWLNKYN